MIDCHLDNQTLWLTLNRPSKANALLPEMLTLIIQHLQQYKNNCHCLIISAQGKHFCAGADLETFKFLKANPEKQKKHGQLWLDFFHTLENFPVPILSLCHGYAGGGALGILAASDLIFATSDSQWILPEARHGLIPATVLPLLKKRWPPYLIRRLSMHTEALSAQRLYDMGLIAQCASTKQALTHHANQWVKAMSEYDHQALLQLKKQLHPNQTSDPLETFLSMMA